MKFSSKHLRSIVAALLLSCVLFSAVGCTSDNKSTDEISVEDISCGILRKEVFALVSSAENSDTDHSLQYGYIEDISDGRGLHRGDHRHHHRHWRPAGRGGTILLHSLMQECLLCSRKRLMRTFPEWILSANS